MRSTLEVDWPLMQNGLDFTAITGAERTYDQLVAALDAQYGSSSSNGDTGIEGARRDASISTRDAQYYASRDTSWAITLSGSTTLNNTPWTLRATSVAKAQANFSTSRATAQAAHDAALLGALEEWRGSSGASSLKSLVSSSRAENDFKSSVAGFWADWNMATEGIDREAPTGFFGSMTDSVMGLMNPFDTDNLAKSFTTEAKPDTTNGPQRPKPSDIHVVYSIYGIVSEHTPEEWEVIREHQTKGRTWEEWMMGGERKRMDAAGFKTSFRKLEEDVPPAKVVPTPTVPSPPPVVPALSNPILTPLDANSELMVSRDDSGLGIFDSIIGMIGGTKGDFVDESFNFTYGVGDNMSLGLGWWLRSTFFHDQADYGGSSYYIGSWVGFAGDLLMGVGAFKALGKTFGREALESGLRNAPVNAARGGTGSNRWWFDMPDGVPPNGPSRFGDDFRNIWRDNPDMPAFSPMTGRHAGEIGVRPDLAPRVRQFWYDHESGHATLTNALRFNPLQQARQGWYNLNGMFTGMEEAIVHGRAVYLNTNSVRMAITEGARYPFEAITGAGQRYISLRGAGTEIIVGAGIAGWINFFWQE
jgi:hypothetical protein